MAPEARGRGAFSIGPRGLVLLSIALAGVWAFLWLDLSVADLVPTENRLALAGEFFGRALSPATEYEGAFVPEGLPPIVLQALAAAWTTLLFAAAATALSLVGGLVLGFFASSAWWAGDPSGAPSRLGRVVRRAVGPAIWSVTRVLIAFMRSIHELFWALLFVTAIGTSHLAAVVAIAIPYAGTLAKVFSEMVDEAPTQSARGLRGVGASDLQVFVFGLLPRALPDLTAYAFYRFECALRSSAILGFFGWPTLGLFIRQSFRNTYFGETWTYLYALLALVVVFDLWSGALRRRIVA